MSVAAAPGGILLADLVAWSGGVLLSPGVANPSATVSGASIDSRTLAPGELFVPLAGGNTDGHAFLAAAFERGAAAALCLRERATTLRGREPGPLVVVDDVTSALQAIAARHRARWEGLLIGVTGSAGKTTTKDLVAAALASDRPTLRTEGNLNNHWGVPLTLLRLSPEHAAAVVEMGMNRPGEIAMLSALSRPQAGVITLVGSAHIEAFGSVEAIAREKTALARALPPHAPVFAGADSPPLLAALAGAPQRVITYGFSSTAHVHPRVFEDLGPEGSRFEVDGFPPCHLKLVGRHQAVNALAAFAVAREYRLDPARIVASLESHVSGKGRMEIRRVRGATLLVDYYNSNPDSARAALATLEHWPGAKRRIALLGDMLELGEQAARLHAETGEAVHGAELWTLGSHAADLAAGAAARGTPVTTFASMADAAAALDEALGPGVVVLLKASRGVALERVLEGLEGN